MFLTTGALDVIIAALVIVILAIMSSNKKDGRDEVDAAIKLKAACREKGSCPLKFTDKELKQRLSPEEYRVTQERGTERPFTGKFDKHKEKGTYFCVVCQKPLFTSQHKFESGCGWPAFSEVLSEAAVVLSQDDTLGMERIEVTCAHCGAHLGHVFTDGPPPKRTRYCINSASLGFTPANQSKQ